MSRSETDEREAASASGSAAGPSQPSEHPSQRRSRPGYGYAVDETRRSHTAHDLHSDPYSQHPVYESDPRDTDRSQHSRGGGALSSSQERQYQHELEMMKAREERERMYGSEQAARSGRPAQADHAYGGVAAQRDAVDEFGPRPTTSERPNLDGFSRVENGKRYRLVVVQHPSRARMCGFGDKDRRPLSPTLIVKLVITDEATDEEISPLDVNTSLFLLATDLCHPEDLMLAPRNILVHHHASSLPVQPTQHGGHSGYPSDEFAYRSGSNYGSYGDGVAPNGDYRSASGARPSNSPDGRSIPGGAASSSSSSSAVHAYDRSPHGQASSSSMQFGGGNFGPQGQAESYTRNLVGAAVASASVLKDEQDKWCTFFVFQDISVRTEGVYRIKLMFVNLEVSGRVGTGVAEALAETYTEPFTVYSPRRFPGMLDPTPLSRKLASQGIKIPVRNDKKKQRRRNDDGGEGDYDGASGGDDDDE
ncbi:hypothetical protein EX895_006060 [Sporisorium graminicola]|uniref:Velvet domain-containing protein n=1 Tax=Sporisorium graminicola TaxID=280036 RepID=A0A4U7KLA4_9BASI|nr:hypothetical protein EX895_006060 [Sporisorium graminicola]TKY84980.1 hypothetical protein EX895_006060 [Sporisorium graminicola]